MFHKSIDDYIVQTLNTNDAQFPGFQVTRAINGDTAKVRGAEFNWQQTLDFLPEGWNGVLVGASASATALDSDFDPGLTNRAGDDFMLPRSSRRIYSGHLGYEKNTGSVRAWRPCIAVHTWTPSVRAALTISTSLRIPRWISV